MRVVKRLFRIIFFMIFWFLVISYVKNCYYEDVTICFTATAQKAVPRFISIHHDAISRETTLDEINRYHKDSCKWSCGFAYHYYISEDKIYKIRDEEQKGAHVFNGNTANIGICLHGNFNKTKPTLKQQILLIILTNYLKIKFNISKQNIKPHRAWEQNKTDCCGKKFDFDAFLKYIID